MREWLQQRRAVLAEHGRVQEAAYRLTSLKQRHEHAFSTLAAALPGEAERAAGQLSALLAAAERFTIRKSRKARF